MKVKTILIIVGVIIIGYIGVNIFIDSNTDFSKSVISDTSILASDACIEMKQYDSAVYFADLALMKNESDTRALERKINAYTELSEYDRALDSYDHILEVNNGELTTEMWLGKGKLHARLGQDEMFVNCYEEAIGDYSEIMAENPGGNTTLIQMGSLLGKLQRYDEALDCYDALLERDQKNAAVWIGKGDAHFYKFLKEQGKLRDLYKNMTSRKEIKNDVSFNPYDCHRQAIECYKKAVELDPMCYPLVVAKILGTYEETIEGYQDILEDL